MIQQQSHLDAEGMRVGRRIIDIKQKSCLTRRLLKKTAVSIRKLPLIDTVILGAPHFISTFLYSGLTIAFRLSEKNVRILLMLLYFQGNIYFSEQVRFMSDILISVS